MTMNRLSKEIVDKIHQICDGNFTLGKISVRRAYNCEVAVSIWYDSAFANFNHKTLAKLADMCEEISYEFHAETTPCSADIDTTLSIYMKGLK